MSAVPILTTHTGSLPRPDRLRVVVRAGAPEGSEAFEEAVRTAVWELVSRQVDLGIDIVSDGEASKPSYVTYVRDRLDGFAGRARRLLAADLAEHPEWGERMMADPAVSEALSMPSCCDPVRYHGQAARDRDIDNLGHALERTGHRDAFLTAASPGVIAMFFANSYYASEHAYLDALADAMRPEYRAIVEAGFVLQIDAPDLAMGRHVGAPDEDLGTFRERAARHVAALDRALRDLPRERLRMHVCWGNYQGPHHLDVELRDVIDILLSAYPAALSFSAANPRHEHEWAVWQDVTLPADKVLVPGVIDPTTRFIEHPDLVAERILRFARIVGPERVIAGTDCGFGTFAGLPSVESSIAWAKLGALVQGARRAAERL